MRNTPILEAVHHMIMLRDQEQDEEDYRKYERQMHYMSLVHSQPLQEDAKQEHKEGRKEFIEKLFEETDKQKEERAKEKKAEYTWSPETMAKIKAMEENGEI